MGGPPFAPSPGYMRSLSRHVDTERDGPIVAGWWWVGAGHELRIKALGHLVARITDDPLRLTGLSDDEHALKARCLSHARRVDRKALFDSAHHYVSERRGGVEDVLIFLPFGSSASSLRSRHRLLQLGRRLGPRSQRHYAGEGQDESNCRSEVQIRDVWSHRAVHPALERYRLAICRLALA